jgi:large subunit ribosomal protein L10
MSTIREGKTAVIDEVRTRLDDASAAVVTEYRGLTVAQMATLRRTLRAVGGDFKVFKNTLVRRAIEGGDHAGLVDLLEGPTAIAFVSGDVSAVAKALRDFARGAPALIVKGGVLDGSLLDARELTALADLPSRDVLLSMFAGALAAPMRTMAGLLKALPQNLAYGLAGLLEQKGGSRIAGDDPGDEADDAPTEAQDAAVPTAEGAEDAPASEAAAAPEAIDESAAEDEATEPASAASPDAEGALEVEAAAEVAAEAAASDSADESPTEENADEA